jgi:hypothetical protein
MYRHFGMFIQIPLHVNRISERMRLFPVRISSIWDRVKQTEWCKLHHASLYYSNDPNERIFTNEHFWCIQNFQNFRFCVFGSTYKCPVLCRSLHCLPLNLDLLINWRKFSEKLPRHLSDCTHSCWCWCWCSIITSHRYMWLYLKFLFRLKRSLDRAYGTQSRSVLVTWYVVNVRHAEPYQQLQRSDRAAYVT